MKSSIVGARQASISLVLACSSAFAQTNHLEIEPNSNKAEATVPTACLTAGDTLTGMTTGATVTAGSTLPTSVDYWRVQTCALPPAIYRHQLALTTGGLAGHTGTLRGLNQTGTVGVGGVAGTTDTVIQTSLVTTTPARMNQWYGFGTSEQLYYRVAGTASTTANYVATLSTTQVTPVDAGNYLPGTITISALGQGHATDTDMWLYDGSFNAIPGYGNDDPPTPTGSPSKLTRTFAAGTYYVAICDFNFANNQVAASDDGWVTGALMDFPDVATNSTIAAGLNCAFSITDTSGTPVQAAVTKTSSFEVVWVKFTVGSGSPFAALCSGDGTGATPCPCGNTGSAGRGCDNSIATGGSLLSAAGSVSPDSVVLTSSGELPSVLSIFLQGDALASPGVLFGDGVRCAGGNLKRLYSKNASGGSVTAPLPGDNSITAQSAILGDPIAPGTSRIYQVYYRDPDLSFCPVPMGSSFNVSSGIKINW
jgi:hypothetical protein